MKIYFIRHSESEDDLNNCYGGCADWKLTENGKRKVYDAKPFFEGKGIQKFYSSPYKRAYETALILANENVVVEKVFDLREINTYGVMSGVEKNLAKELFKTFLELDEYKKIGYYHGKSFYGGEPTREFDVRVQNAIEKIVSNSTENVIGVVTHGGVFRSIFKNILNVQGKILNIEDVAYAEVIYDDGKFELVSKNGITLN